MKRNRRKFLKGATAVTAATAVSPVIAKQAVIGGDKEQTVPATPPTHQQRADESGEPDIATPEYSAEEQATLSSP